MCETFHKFMMKNRANDDDDDNVMNANDLILGRHGALENYNFSQIRVIALLSVDFFVKISIDCSSMMPALISCFSHFCHVLHVFKEVKFDHLYC